jgi:hypothetical protein
MPYTTCLFGVDMPILDPGTAGVGDPGNSWLLYKTLLGVPSGNEQLNYACSPFVTSETTAPSQPSNYATERAVLSNYILGREMPYPSNPGLPEGTPQTGCGGNYLSVAEIERIRLWIQQGAQLETVTITGPDGGPIDAGLNCSMCQPIDAGLPDAPPSDGPMDAEKDVTKD